MDPEKAVIEKDLTARLLGYMREREKLATTLYFGLDGQPSLSFGEVSKELGVCPQRASQIIARGMDRARSTAIRRRIISRFPERNH